MEYWHARIALMSYLQSYTSCDLLLSTIVIPRTKSPRVWHKYGTNMVSNAAGTKSGKYMYSLSWQVQNSTTVKPCSIHQVPSHSRNSSVICISFEALLSVKADEMRCCEEQAMHEALHSDLIRKCYRVLQFSKGYREGQRATTKKGSLLDIASRDLLSAPLHSVSAHMKGNTQQEHKANLPIVWINTD